MKKYSSALITLAFCSSLILTFYGGVNCLNNEPSEYFVGLIIIIVEILFIYTFFSIALARYLMYPKKIKSDVATAVLIFAGIFISIFFWACNFFCNTPSYVQTYCAEFLPSIIYGLFFYAFIKMNGNYAGK